MFRAILTSARKSITGEEKLWKVFWLWGILIQITAMPIGFLAIGLWNTCPNIVTGVFGVVIAMLGLIFVFIYPFIFIITLWRCARNTAIKGLFILARMFIVLFIFIHLIIGTYSFVGTLWIVGHVIYNEYSHLSEDGCFAHFYKYKAFY